MGALSGLDPATIKAFETYLGLPVDGVWDGELASRVGGYQTLLGQTPGQTRDAAEWEALTAALKRRGEALSPSADPVPMQDIAFQTFLRESGARESELLDEIQWRTEQSTREINRRAAGFELDRENTRQKIQTDYRERGFGNKSSFRDRDEGRATTEIDNQQLGYEAGVRDDLQAALRNAQSDINSLYRRRADEELAARQRVGQRTANETYTYVGR